MSLFDDLPAENASTTNEDGGMESGRKRSSCDSLNDHTPPAKLTKTWYCYELKGYIGERRGEREDMQDAHTIIDDFTPEFASLPNKTSRVAYYGVFDGHAGNRASTYTAEHLHQNIKSCLPKGNVHNLDREVKKCLLESFKKTDEDFLREAANASPSWKDGSTVAALLVLDNTLYSANLGDSKAILCRVTTDGKRTIIPLTKDHNPTNFDERRRIEKAGEKEG
jgi:integrin-linked kinase-associated serine/threonine phosphatase 2C